MQSSKKITRGFIEDFISDSTQTELDLKANDIEVVHLLGNESISGLKTFTSLITAPSFVIPSGLNTQFLKADGSLDSTTYLTSETDTLQDVTSRGATTTTTITSTGFIKGGGTAAQFLKANGSVDDNVYLTAEIDTLQSVTSRGNITVTSLQALSFVKTGGLSTEFLKADGTVDNTLYATNSLVMHLAGNETFTGTKTFNGQNAFNLTNNVIGAGAVLNIANQNNGSGIIITQGASGQGIQLNAAGGTGMNVVPQGGATGINISNAIGNNNRLLSLGNNGGSSSFGIHLTNANNGTGVGIYINNTLSTSGKAIKYDKNGVEKAFLDDIGNWSAQSIIKVGGLSTEFLKANGTVDSTVYATDSLVLHKAGSEVFTGTKIFNVAFNDAPAFLLTNAIAGSLNSYAINVDNTNDGVGIKMLNSNNGNSIYINNTGTSAIGLSINSSTTAAGKGISVTNSSTGTGIFSQNSGTGYAYFAQNNAGGTGIRIDNSSLASGNPFVYSKNNVVKAFLNDAGDWSAQSLIAVNNITLGSTSFNENRLKLSTYIHSTGLATWGANGILATGASTFNVDAAIGYIVSSSNPLGTPPIAVNYPGGTGLTTPFLGSAPATYILINSSSVLVLQNTRPTVTERRDNIFLGVIGHPNGAITGVGNSPDLIGNAMSQVRAMFEPTRLINEGVVPYAGAADLSLYNTAGKLYGFGIGFIANGSDASSLINVAGGAPMTTQYRTSVGIPSVGGTNRTTAVPNRYESGGVDIAIPGSSNQATNQRFYLLQNGAIRIQYGQVLYATLADAIAGATNEAFVVNINAINLGILIGILSIQKGATNLQNTAQARFLPVSKFGETVGAAAGISIGTLQTGYNNSLNPEILTNSILGALSIRRGSAADTDNVLEVQNNAGTSNFTVTGNGVATAASFVKTGGTSVQYLLANGTTTSQISNQSIASQTLTATTRTYVTGSNLVFPTTALQIGSRLRFVLAISKTAAGTATSTIDFAVGTAGTTADTARLSFTKPSGTAAVDTGHIILNVVVRAIGASAILVGTISLIANNTNSGLLQNQETYVETVVSSAFNITTATNMGICYTSGAAEVLTIDLVTADSTNFI